MEPVGKPSAGTSPRSSGTANRPKTAGIPAGTARTCSGLLSVLPTSREVSNWKRHDFKETNMRIVALGWAFVLSGWLTLSGVVSAAESDPRRRRQVELSDRLAGENAGSDHRSSARQGRRRHAGDVSGQRLHGSGGQRSASEQTTTGDLPRRHRRGPGGGSRGVAAAGLDVRLEDGGPERDLGRPRLAGRETAGRRRTLLFAWARSRR